MKLIVGLGNPGKEYEGTRHNVGFAAADFIASKSDGLFSFEKKMNADVAKAKLGGESAILAKPRTFVNKTGEAVKKLRASYKLKTQDVILIHDDLDIEFGDFKISFAKNSGGHRGVQSVIDSLKTNKFWRVRLGIANAKLKSARNQNNIKAKKTAVGNFVLTQFSKAELGQLKKILQRALDRLAESSL